MIQDIDEINVSIQDDNSINVSIDNDSISVSEAAPTDIAEIMHNEEIRQENETQRIANEEQRIENETAREDYINDLKQRVLDGEFNGQDGQDGQDGFSPIASVSKSGDTATITITDKNGTTTAQISDGVDGVDGEDGFSPSASVTKSGSVATITITDKSGTTTANIYDGSGGGGGGSWGSITGNIADQTDLQNALDGKQATIDSSHKLSSDLVDDTSNTNKFINSSAQTFTGTKTFSHINTDSEIITDSLTTYSSISINDEADDNVFTFDGTTSGTPMFNRKLELSNGGTTTAPTSNNDIANKKYVDDNIPDISTKQDKIDSSHMLDADLVDDSTSTNKFLTGSAQTIAGVKTFMALPQYYYDLEPVLDNELITKAYADNKFEYQKTSLPTASEDFYGSIFQYIGTTTANYTNGYYYKCTRSGTSPNYTYSWERLDVQPSFSGNYNDLSNKPTIPDELADLSDDSTHRVVTDTEKTTWSGKQDALVSGTNIKTINNTSLLGSGNIDIEADTKIYECNEYTLQDYQDLLAIIQKMYDDYTDGINSIVYIAKAPEEARKGFYRIYEPTTGVYRLQQVYPGKIKRGIYNGESSLLEEYYFLSLSVSGGIVSITDFSTSTESQVDKYLSTTVDYGATTYSPQYDGSPATKKYVDDSIVQSDWSQTTTTAKDYIKNKPTIPTVNNATLTIQKNGTTVKTFTANASSNVTANITVPDISGGTGYVKYSDGTMICWGSKTGTTTYSDFWGLVKRSPEGNSAIQVSLPQSFKDKTYSVQLTPLYSSTTIFCAQEGDNYKATNSFRVVCFTPTGNGGNAYGFMWMVVGKWK